MRSSSILAAAAAVLAIASSASADVITDWNGTGIEILRDRAVGPNKSTRALAIAQLAAYDAVVAITKTHEPYLPGLEAELPASPEAAAAQAAHDVLLALYPDAAEELADALEDSLDALEDGDAEDNGVALGKGLPRKRSSTLAPPIIRPTPRPTIPPTCPVNGARRRLPTRQQRIRNGAPSLLRAREQQPVPPGGAPRSTASSTPSASPR